MKTILVPLDGSALAEHVLPYVREIAPLLDADIRLLRVIPDTAIENGETFGYDLATLYGVAEAVMARQEHDARVRETLRERAAQYLATLAEQLTAAGFQATTEVRCGPPAEVIVEVAESEHVAMIAMGTHGYGGVRRWALGSTTDRVVHATSTPVLLVRADAPDPAPTLQRIVLPLDGSAIAEQALPLAVDLARRAGAELVLLRATMPMIEIGAGMPPAGRMPPQIEDLTETIRGYAEEELNTLAGRLRGEIAQVLVHAPVGSAAEVIVDEAAEHADLIVMATHGYSGLRRWALGSTADKVLHASRTPLLLVRAKA